jgi:protease I
MELTGKKVAVFVDKLYQEIEVWYPYFRLREAGAETIFVGAKAGETYESKLGYPATAEKAYDNVTALDFDGVIVPGGFAPDYIRRYPKATQLVKDIGDAGKLVAAICHGPAVLCSSHGILKGRRATSFFAIKDDVINAGAIWEDAEVVVDGGLITSRKPEDLPAFCREAIRVLSAQN